MRTLSRAFVSCAACAAVVSVGLFLAPSATATYNSCPTWNVSYQGPCAVDSTTNPVCLPAGQDGAYTAIKYAISGGQISNAAVLLTSNNFGAGKFFVKASTGVSVANPCVGDVPTALGKNSCHEFAVRINPNTSNAAFWVIVPGPKQAVQSSISVNKGSCTKAYIVPGLGLDTNVFQPAQKRETINYKGCAFDFDYDSLTGAVVSTGFNEDQSTKDLCVGGEPAGTCCSELIAADIDKLSLKLDAAVCASPPCDLGLPKFGNGYISSGENSCTTRVIGGRVYTWGSPCPE